VAVLSQWVAQRAEPEAPATSSPATLDQILERLDAIERRLST
jgi:hypothetical protein